MTAPDMSGWSPDNDVEHALLEALTEDNRREYFQIIANAELFLPAFVASGPGERQRFLTMNLFGQEFLPVYTTPRSMAFALGASAPTCVSTSYFELRRKWPDPSWRLAVNPGTPIDAYLGIEDVVDVAVGDAIVQRPEEMVAETRQQMLATAIRDRDGEGYLAALMTGTVWVPTSVPVAADTPLGPGFPWRLTPGTGTSAVELTVPPSAPPPGPAVEVPFVAVLAAWPDPAWDLVVSTEAGPITIAGEYVLTLAVTAAEDPDPV